jgi:hypothetical protein
MPQKSSDPGLNDTRIPARPVVFDSAGVRTEFRDEEFWKRHMRRFYLAAVGFLKRRFRGRPPASIDAWDVLSSAVSQILSGARHCPEDLDPVVFVLGVIKSVASHSGDPAEFRMAHHSISAVPDEGGNLESAESQLAGRSTVASLEEKIEARELVQDFLRIVPERYRGYVRLLVSRQYRTAADRAKAMGLSVAEVRNLDKAVRRLRPLWKGMPIPE